jgi:hypothetical protein
MFPRRGHTITALRKAYHPLGVTLLSGFAVFLRKSNGIAALAGFLRDGAIGANWGIIIGFDI